MPLYQRCQVELVLGVKAARKGRAFLIEHAVSADDALMLGAVRAMIENKNMIAHGVEAVCIAPVKRLQVA